MKSWKITLVSAIIAVLCLSPVAGSYTIRYTYDDSGRLLGADYGGGQAVIYRYDDAGNLLKKIYLPTMIGDVYIDGEVDLKDALFAFQISDSFQKGITGGDVNGDGAVGNQEAMYILQVLAELR